MAIEKERYNASTRNAASLGSDLLASDCFSSSACPQSLQVFVLSKPSVYMTNQHATHMNSYNYVSVSIINTIINNLWLVPN